MAHPIQLLADCDQKSVIEIGPGMGRTAYAYRWTHGLRRLSVARKWNGRTGPAFLGAALGPEKIWMPGDSDALAEGRIKLLVAGCRPDQTYGLTLNADSMTEMPLPAALDYLNWIRQSSRLFLSINHDRNLFTVAQVSTKWFTLAERRPYPMRDSYMEEIFIPRHFPWLISWHRIVWHSTKNLVRRAIRFVRRLMQ